MAEFVFYPFTLVIFVVFGILICTSMARKKKRNQRAMLSAPVIVASQQMPTNPAHPVQFQAGPAGTFQPNPSAPYPQNMQYHMPMPNYQNQQPFQQPYQNVYPQQPPPYPGVPQQQTDNNQVGFKIDVNTFSSTAVGRNYEESSNSVARY
ncbi:uncharacterized protein [Chironomus tepperi]|uniref:uncharacterized protein isoform X2 n=1 Tax=Chironomus tepperi TaxID=113505 RepID=UPI00391EFAB4